MARMGEFWLFGALLLIGLGQLVVFAGYGLAGAISRGRDRPIAGGRRPRRACAQGELSTEVDRRQLLGGEA
jgi:hypothetical protein